MDSNIQKSLEGAKAHFYSLRLVECYNILRRYFDRLPFKPEKEHAEYIGMFARVLAELGKEYDLKFYLEELERHYEKVKSPAISYQLAVVYSYLSEPKMESARRIFENIIRDPEAKEYQAKAKMMLADYYNRKSDFVACRLLVESIQEPQDPTLRLLLEIWRSVVLRNEKKLPEAETKLEKIFSQVSAKTNWYVYFSAKVVLSMVLMDKGEKSKAKMIADELRSLFQGRHFKSVSLQMAELEKHLCEDSPLGPVRFIAGDGECTFVYQSKVLVLKRKTPSEKLLSLLIQKRFIDKTNIVKNLFAREYNGEQDDKLIYYHVHTLRKRLKSVGLPPGAILNEKDGYRWLPRVEALGGNCEP